MQTIDDLRRHLFAALDGLANKETPMELERARAISDIAQTLINSAKVEVEYIRVTGRNGSGFIPDAKQQLPAPADSARGISIRVHRIKG